jgi:glycosidase
MAESKLSDEERENGVFLLKAAVLMQMTLPGIPCIYYGDEAGMEGYSDPFSRRFFPWENIDADIYDYYKKICAFRKENKNIFAGGEYQLVCENNGLFCYKRVGRDDIRELRSRRAPCEKKEIYIYVNLSNQNYKLNIKNKPLIELKAKSCDIFVI